MQQWAKVSHWENLLNRRGTTWRNLSEQEKSKINKSRVLKLMVEQPTLIKRPVLEYGKQIIVGYLAESYKNLFIPRG